MSKLDPVQSKPDFDRADKVFSLHNFTLHFVARTFLRGFRWIITIGNFFNLVDFGLIRVRIIVLIVLGIAWNGHELGSLERL
ncbi:hypothetical protein LWI28_019021 [Acer negundo]|uniref:Uncharacterized protein n=1 Tax=Acer negundo TaxID=4023 RepID=A0AAD5JDJ7_ACENE|nr:hypothetical protein LWI28_019021 [Acer negundo]